MKKPVVFIVSLVLFILVATPGASASNFGRLFPNLPGFTFVSNQALSDLAQTQLDAGQVDGPNSHEESVPPDNPTMQAAFTYFAAAH